MMWSHRPQRISVHVGSLSSTEKSDITLVDVRRFATQSKPKWVELKHSPTLRIVSFRRKSERIIVYYATGTVTTSSNSAKSYVRTNVDTVLLKQLFADPRKDISDGFSPLRTSKAIFDDNPQTGKIQRSCSNRYLKIWGNDKLWWSSNIDINEFYKCIHKDISQSVCLLAIPSGGILCAMKDGQAYWSAGGILDDAVEQMLGNGDIKARHIALGTKGRYYISFAKGDEVWCGHEDFDETVRESAVKCVAFGDEFDSYFVLHENNICTWRNIPESLENTIRDNCKNGTVVDYVSLGCKRGQYFVHFNNDVWYASGLCEEDKHALEKIDGAVKEVSFCKGGLVVRYSHFHEQKFVDTQNEDA